jgi:hypothetical protein
VTASARNKKKLVFLKLKENLFYFKKRAILCYCAVLFSSCILVTLKFRPSQQVCRPGEEQADKLKDIIFLGEKKIWACCTFRNFVQARHAQDGSTGVGTNLSKITIFCYKRVQTATMSRNVFLVN